MKLTWLLFDMDNTLLNSDSACKEAFFRTCENFKVSADDELFSRYEKINTIVWEKFERGDITATRLRALRFELFFQAEEIEPCPPLPEMLTKWKKEYKLSIVTNGLWEVQRARLAKLDLTKYFDSIQVRPTSIMFFKAS